MSCADAPDLPTARHGAVPALQEGIELRDVWFSYDETSPGS